MDFSALYSYSALSLKSSKIRELFKLTKQKGLISMAGGMPDSQNLPFDIIKEIISKWDKTKSTQALQYGTTKGFPPLLEEIGTLMEKNKKISMDGQDILITTGSQQALSIISKVLLNRDEVVIVEIPSFIGAIASFYSYNAKVVGVEMDEEGLIPEKLESMIKRIKDEGRVVKFIYTIPNFNNPSGVTLSPRRRRALKEISDKYNIPIVEDDPYGDLFFEGKAEDYLPIKSIDIDGNVIYLGSFSKVLSPGMRVGWIVAQEDFIAKAELQKQSFDACTPLLSQVIAHDYLAGGYMTGFVEKMRNIYREKCNAMLEALQEYMPEGVRWTKPKGGLFVWVTLPDGITPEELFMESINEKVAFVTGDAFLPEDYPNRFIRLTYGDLPVERIREGVRRIAKALNKLLRV